MAEKTYPLAKWDNRAERLEAYQKWIDALHEQREQGRKQQSTERADRWKSSATAPPLAAGQSKGGPSNPSAQGPAAFHTEPPPVNWRKEDRAKNWQGPPPQQSTDYGIFGKVFLPNQFGQQQSSGGFQEGKSGNSDLKDLIAAIKELIHELRDKKTVQQPGLQPDGSFVPSLTPQQSASPQQSAGPRAGANRGGAGGLHGPILRTLFGR